MTSAFMTFRGTSTFPSALLRTGLDWTDPSERLRTCFFVTTQVDRLKAESL